MLDSNTEQTKKLAWALSLAGVIPFAVISIALFVMGDGAPLFSSFLDIFKIWSALILSFLGGIRWGLAIAFHPFDTRSLLYSVIPSILAWFAILLPDIYCVFALLILFCAHGAWDSFYVNAGKAPPWFGTIRIVITLLVALAHILVAIGISGGVSVLL